MKLTTISLHFFGFSFILCSIQNLWVSLAARSRILIEFLGMISTTVVSSTYLDLRCQSLRSLFIIIANSVTPSLVPWGTNLRYNINTTTRYNDTLRRKTPTSLFKQHMTKVINQSEFSQSTSYGISILNRCLAASINNNQSIRAAR